MNEQRLNMSQAERDARFSAMNAAMTDLTADSQLGFLCSMVIDTLANVFDPMERLQLAMKFCAVFNAASAEFLPVDSMEFGDEPVEAGDELDA